jgi:hypothetical protein
VQSIGKGAIGPAQPGPSRIQVRLIPAGDHHTGTGGQERLRDRQADAA